MINGLNVFQQAPRVYAPLLDLSCPGFAMPSGSEFVFWLLPNKQLLLNKQLLPAISRCYGLAGRPDCSNWGAFCSCSDASSATSALPTDLYTPRTSASASAPGRVVASLRENSPDARRNHFPLAHLCPCLFQLWDFWPTAVAYGELTKAGTLLSSLKSARGLLRCNLQPTDCSSMTRRDEQSLAHRERSNQWQSEWTIKQGDRADASLEFSPVVQPQ